MKYISSYINEELNTEMVLLFILVDESWYKIFVSDGKSSLVKENNPPNDSSWEMDGDSFSYMVKPFQDLDILQFEFLEKIEEYLYKGFADESGGLLFTFSNGKKVSIIDEDENMRVTEGDNKDMLKNEYILNEFNFDKTV